MARNNVITRRPVSRPPILERYREHDQTKKVGHNSALSVVLRQEGRDTQRAPFALNGEIKTADLEPGIA